jgi:hypothetical protein
MRIQSCEFFQGSRTECLSCGADVWNDAEPLRHASDCPDNGDVSRTEGVCFWTCQPGCLPDSGMCGPFRSMDEAIGEAIGLDFIDARYEYVINLDERGEFYADVRTPDGDTVIEVRSDAETGEVDLVTDGFMNHARDTDGLEAYLKSHELLPNWAYLELVG